MSSGSERIAEALRAEEPQLDDVSRARMEKRLVEATRVGRREPARREARATGRLRWAVLGAAVAAAAAAGIVVLRDASVEPAETAGAASFQAYERGETVRRGAFAEGETVRTNEGERVEVRLPDARVDVTPSTVAEFVRFDADVVDVAVTRGAVEVEFHPQRRGEQSLTVSTPAARIEVVGTIFRVEADDESTTVRVTQGVVRVVPADGTDTRMVHAGEATRVARTAAAERASAETPGGPAGGAGGDPGEAALGSAEGGAGSSAGPAPASASPAEGGAALDETVEVDEAIADGAPVRPESEDAAPELSVDARFDLADVFFRRNQMERARHVLRGIIRSPVRRAHRTRAWTAIAESYEREQNWPQATEAYRRASDAGRGTVEGRNALYAYGRMLERRLADADGAKAAYRRYIDQAAVAQLRGQGPSPHLDLCRQRLCQLGDRAYCR